MSRPKTRSVPALYRWSVASRVLAAIVGGYALAALLSAVLAMALPRISDASRADAVLIATLLSFVVYTVVALWVFCARTALRAWLWLLAVGVVGLAALVALRGGL
ncbi:MAG: iron transporter [Rubrivivax sp.]|nr:MAG: iron transporter [Rubrivivax sp.]